MTERMSQIMHPYLRQPGPVSRSFPSVIPDAGQSLATVCEDNARMLALFPFNDFSGDPIENHYSFAIPSIVEFLMRYDSASCYLVLATHPKIFTRLV